MKITENIKQALMDYLRESGKSASEFADELNVYPSTTCNWINGESKTIKKTHWKRVQEYLRPYLERYSARVASKRKYGDEHLKFFKDGFNSLKDLIIDDSKIDPVQKEKLLMNIREREKALTVYWKRIPKE